MAARDLTASTINYWLTNAGVIDAAYNTFYLLDTLMGTAKKQAKRGVPQKKSAMRTLDGGYKIQDAPILNKSTGPTNITGDEVIVGRGHDPLEKAEWEWCWKGDIVQMNEIDRLKNAGNERMVDEWQTRVSEKINAQRYSVQYDIAARDSGTAVSSYYGFYGLPYLLDTTGQSDTKAVAGITRNGTTYPGWSNQTETSAGAFATYYTKLIIERAICEGETGTMWDLIVTTPSMWAAMANFLASKGEVQFQNDKDPDPYYSKFTWAGAKVVMDKNITSGYIYGIPTEHMFFACHKDANFKIYDSYEASNQFVVARKLLLGGNIGFRRFDGAASTSGWS